MPNRILKESINESARLSEISVFSQDLFKRLITYADDYGRFNADPVIMRARLYPREFESVFIDDVIDALEELGSVGKISFYTNKGRVDGVFGCFPKWGDHQRIRNTRAKTPEPEEEVNDWALRRFVPIELKVRIYERDKFTCQKCQRSFELPNIPNRRAMRLLEGALHIDHIVPVNQGGRATEENLRLLCASCNLSRDRKIDWLSPLQVAADGRELPQTAALRARAQNPNPNPNPNPIRNDIPPIVPQGTLLSKKTETKQTGAVVAENQVTSGENPPSRTKFVLPDWIKPETWSAFKEMRQKSRAPLTDSAAKLLLHKLDRFRAAGDDPNLVLEQSIMSGYRGVFPLKKGGTSGVNKTNSRQVRPHDQYTDPDTL